MLAATQEEHDVAQTALASFGDKNNPLSPDYHFARIKKVLQGDWATTDAEIKGNKINSKVTEEVVREIGGLSVSETKEQL